MARVCSEDSKNATSLHSKALAVITSLLLAAPMIAPVQAFGEEGNVEPQAEHSEEVTLAASADTAWYYDNPTASTFNIDTLDELLGLAYLANEEGVSFAGQIIILMADIDTAEAAQWIPIAKGERSGRTFVPEGSAAAFAGIFDGNGHSIGNITISAGQGTGNFAYGLFGCVDGGTVRNLNLYSATINVGQSELAAAAIGMLTGGGIASNISVDEYSSITAIRGNGAIVGRMIDEGTIENCTNNATVTGTGANIGGIVGAAYYTSANKEMNIIGCVNNGTVSGSGPSAAVIGGIAGLSCANITNCRNTAIITGDANAGCSVGGIVGEQQVYGTVSGNINEESASVTGSMAGGIVGWVRYASYNATDYERYEIITVSENENYATVTSLDGGLKSAGGIVGHLYDYAVVTANRNYAPSLTTYNFTAGIVGSIQAGNNPLSGIFSQSVLVEDNLSTTPLDAMTHVGTGPFNRALHAYNNVQGFANVIDNYIAVLETPEEALALIDSVIGSGAVPTREMVNAVASTIRHADESIRDGLNTPEASEALADLEEATYQYNNASDGRMIRPTAVNHDPQTTPGLLGGNSISGAALSVPVLSTGTRTAPMANQAILNLADPTYIPDDSNIPVHLKSGSTRIIFDATLDIADDNDALVREGIQPAIPVTMTLNLDGATLGDVDPDSIIIVSYRKNEITQQMEASLAPIFSAEKTGDNYQVKAGFTQLSTVLVGLKGDFTVSANNVETSYDGAAHGVDAVAYIDNGAVADAVITYFDGTDYTLNTSPSFVNVTQGAQAVLFKASLFGYADVYGQATVTVDKADLTVSVEGARKTETYTGSALSASGFSYDNSDKVSVALKPGSRAYAEGVEAGTYTMGLSADLFTATDLTGGNYNITLAVTDGYLTILPAKNDDVNGSPNAHATGTTVPSQLAKAGDPINTGVILILVSSMLPAVFMGLMTRRSKQK